jgi:GT2 family glycosyltransferase
MEKPMPEISIILPSLRKRVVLRRIKEFRRTNDDSDYEIIVVSPFRIDGVRVVHIQEEKPLGTIHAHNVAFKSSSGRYIVWWADDSSPTKNCLSDMLNFIRSKKEPFVGSFRVKDRRGHELVQWSVFGKLYACFGCASRNTINLIGGYFDTVYSSYWADPDMCLRTWEKGGRVEVCPNAWVVTETFSDKVSTINARKYYDKDKETFFNRWYNTLGEGIEKTFNAVNKPVGNGQVLPTPSLYTTYTTLPNRMLGICTAFVPEKIKVAVRLAVSIARHRVR